jgi:hypothetical protein
MLNKSAFSSFFLIKRIFIIFVCVIFFVKTSCYEE